MADPSYEGCSPGHRPAHCSSAGTTRHHFHYMQLSSACQQTRDTPGTPHAPSTADTPVRRPTGANVGRMGTS